MKSRTAYMAAVAVALALVSLLLGGCDDRDVLRIHVVDLVNGPSDDLPEAVLEACDMWQIECVPEPDKRARDTMHIVMIPSGSPDDWRAGTTISDWGNCRRVVLTPHRAALVAHEIGHLLLDTHLHVDDAHNVMHAQAGLEITDEQIDRAAEQVRRIGRCV